MNGQDELGIEGIEGAIEIGRGGFGVVYRAHEVDLGRTVAVKVLGGPVDADHQRFDRERKAMGALSDHPNIVTVHRTGFTADGKAFLLMEHVGGGSVADLLATGGRLPWQRAVAIGTEIADALTVAHRSGVLHRDIKPGNILLTDEGRAKLGDFGIARLHGAPETRSAVVTASVAHAPPEVLAGARPDARSDLYSLASTIFECIWGTPAFAGGPDEESLLPMINRIASMPMPDLSGAGVPPEVTAVLATAMAKRPEDRQPDVATFAAALRAAAAPTPPQTVPPRAVPAQTVPPQAAPAHTVPAHTLPAHTVPHAPQGDGNRTLWLIAAGLGLLVVLGLGAIVAQGLGDDGETAEGSELEVEPLVGEESSSATTDPSSEPSSTPPPTTQPPSAESTTTQPPVTEPPTTEPPTTNLAQGPDRFVSTSDGRVTAMVPAAWTVTEADTTSFLVEDRDGVSDPNAWAPGVIVLYFSVADGYEPSDINENQLMDDVLATTTCAERERHFYDDGAGLTGTYLIADRCDGVAGQSLYLVAAGASDDSFVTAIAIAYPTGDDSVVFSILDSLEFP